MSVNPIEPDRSELRHAQAGLAVALRCVRRFVELLDAEQAEKLTDRWCEQLEDAIDEAVELLDVADVRHQVGEVPPIPAQEVPPIPAGPVVGLDFWRRDGND